MYKRQAGIAEAPEARGYIAKGAVLAIKMREALYYGDWQKAKDAAKAIIDLKQYELDPDYANLFKVSGVDSKEIILADQNIETLDGLGTIGQMYNNVDQGWSSICLLYTSHTTGVSVQVVLSRSPSEIFHLIHTCR